MAAASLLALIDDIASVLDDVSVLTKVAAKKTAGVLGDDLALNAQQVTGLKPDRELPVVWAVAKGSIVNKLILVPSALAISAFAPVGRDAAADVGRCVPLLRGLREDRAQAAARGRGRRRRPPIVPRWCEALADPTVDLVALEKSKIKGAVRTDFILSAEIVAITLGTVAEAAFTTQVAVLSGIAAIMTVGVYGLVAGIVKLDDAGLYLSRRSGEGRLRRTAAQRRPRHPAPGAVPDEVPVDRRDGGDVPGGWGDPHARHSCGAPLDRGHAPVQAGAVATSGVLTR